MDPHISSVHGFPSRTVILTVEPQFHEPLYNEFLGIMNDFLEHGQI